VAPWIDTTEAVRGTIVDSPRVDGQRQRVDIGLSAVRSEAAADDDAWEPAIGRLCAILPASPSVRLGDGVLVVGTITPLVDLPLGINQAFGSRGCGASLYATWIVVESQGSGWQRQVAGVRQGLTAAIRRAAPGDAGALLAGLATGDDHALSDDRRQAFLRTGTTHITAVSGANLALVVTAALAIAAAGGWRQHLAWQLATITAIWGYALLTGLAAPVTRAALVASGVVLAARVGRRPDLLTLTVLAAAAMVALQPRQLESLSFQLSFVSSLALVVVLAGSAPTGFGGWVWTIIRASAAAQLATLPVTLAVFGTVALGSIPTNLLIGPLVAVAFPLAVLAAPVAWLIPAVGSAVALPAIIGASAIFAVVDRLGANDRTILVLGRTSLAETLVVTVIVTFAVGGMSEEGRRGWRRATAALQRTPPPRKDAGSG